MSTGTLNTRSNVSAVKLLIVLGLAWSQLAYATHQFEHDAVDLGEDCTVCVQFERDDALVDVERVCVSPAAVATIPVAVLASTARTEYTLYSARASP